MLQWAAPGMRYMPPSKERDQPASARLECACVGGWRPTRSTDIHWPSAPDLGCWRGIKRRVTRRAQQAGGEREPGVKATCYTQPPASPPTDAHESLVASERTFGAFFMHMLSRPVCVLNRHFPGACPPTLMLARAFLLG